MAITFKKRDDLEKMLENFAVLPELEATLPDENPKKVSSEKTTSTKK